MAGRTDAFAFGWNAGASAVKEIATTTEYSEYTERENLRLILIVIFLHSREGEITITITRGRPKAELRFLFQDQFTHSSSPFPCFPSVPWFTPTLAKRPATLVKRSAKRISDS